MQIFVRHERSIALEVEPSDTIVHVKARIAEKTRLPAETVRLIFGGKQLSEACTLSEHSIGKHATIHLVHSLLGGKGGFGAMLRTAGARGVKTTNFDACRDLNGRRLRHVNAEAQLREWDAQAEERKLKKQQQDALNAKPTGPAPVARFDDDEYEELLQVCDATNREDAGRTRTTRRPRADRARVHTPCESSPSHRRPLCACCFLGRVHVAE